MRSTVDSRAPFVLACSMSLFAACATEGGTTAISDPLPRLGAVEEWTPSFQDEFDTAEGASSRWFAWSGDLHHKNTINAARTSLAALRSGSMIVSAVPTPYNPTFPYATGYVDTRGRFAQTYGKIEFRARCQHAPGVWYALWGRSWASLVPEIDIEFLAENTTQVWFVNHWGVPPLPPDERRGFTTVNGMDVTQFHTYTVVWTPDLVEWQIDGTPYRRITERARIPHEPMFWVMNAWVGGWGGTPTASTLFPAELEVDYLRISRLRTWLTDPQIRVVGRTKNLRVTEKLSAELADFGERAHVEVWEGAELLVRRMTPPFELTGAELGRGTHSLRFVGTDGVRSAATALDVTVD